MAVRFPRQNQATQTSAPQEFQQAQTAPLSMGGSQDRSGSPQPYQTPPPARPLPMFGRQAGVQQMAGAPPPSITGGLPQTAENFQRRRQDSLQLPPGPAAPEPNATPQTEGSGLDPELDSLYQDIFKEHQGSWADTEKGINAQTAMNQRRAAEINASMGRSIGGGFAGLYSQAMLNGQQQMTGARQTWADRGRQLQLGYLDRQITEKHRTEELENEAARSGSGVPTTGLPVDPGSLTSGLTGDYDSLTKDQAARRKAEDIYNAASKFEKRQQAFKHWGNAPAELQSVATSYQNEDQRYDFMSWAYSQFLANGRWPTVAEARQASTAGVVG